MTTNRHKYFRWTPRTAGLTFMYAIVVPSIVGVIAYQTDVSGAPSSEMDACDLFSPFLFCPSLDCLNYEEKGSTGEKSLGIAPINLPVLGELSTNVYLSPVSQGLYDLRAKRKGDLISEY
ncbi:hypothetical protein GGS20DRAFT_569441 [Poronia punctata]|nr:hypothetical protein GGS20DRAFT_569441 [Poronia punctata]